MTFVDICLYISYYCLVAVCQPLIKLLLTYLLTLKYSRWKILWWCVPPCRPYGGLSALDIQKSSHMNRTNATLVTANISCVSIWVKNVRPGLAAFSMRIFTYYLSYGFDAIKLGCRVVWMHVGPQNWGPPMGTSCIGYLGLGIGPSTTIPHRLSLVGQWQWRSNGMGAGRGPNSQNFGGTCMGPRHGLGMRA